MFAARGGFEYTAVTTSGGSYIATFNTVGAPATTIAVSTGNINYFVTHGLISGAAGNILIVKMNDSGNIQWQKEIDGNVDVPKDAALDSTGNLYICGYTNSGTAGGQDGYLTKVNSDGNILWQRRIGTTYTSDSETGVAVEPGDANVYIAFSGNNTVNMARYNSSGTLGFQRQIDANADTAYDITSTSGNAFVLGQGGNDIFMTKINSGGTTQNAKSIRQTGETLVPMAVTSDSTGNVIMLSRRAGGNVVISKHYSNTEVIDSVTYNSVNGTIGGVAVDSSDNIYVTTNVGSNNIWYARLYNGNLQPQWQRTLTSGTNMAAYNISEANGYVYLTGRAVISGTYQALTAKLPNDGSGQGTYGIYTIANSSYTSNTASYTTANSANATTSTLTTGTPTLTIANSSYTQTLTTV